ncbi:type II secretion system F family protein [Terrabacter sp. NPDC000476]|uniref:type II secretion system F family protein n=1 Tax=Terrabacter sp. NPDC000476 TaxID=3154258 RepID=UPI0033246E2E
MSWSVAPAPAPWAAAALVGLAVLVLLGGPGPHGWRRALGRQGRHGADGADGADGAARRQLRGAPRSGRSGARPMTDDEVASALALLALAYRSGLPTWDVLDAVAAASTGPARTDLRQVATALRWGATEAEAWDSVGPLWTAAARALAVAHSAGVPPGPLLLSASDDLRAAELERVEVAAAQVGVRLVAPLGLVLLPAFCLTTVVPLVLALAGDLLRP